MLNNINIVLVNPSHPGNIGATARAMKTMELSRLSLVAPQDFPSAKATALAAGADDILAHATVTTSLPATLKDSHIIFGTSARQRALALTTVTPKEAAIIIHNSSPNHQISILFGRENNGLTNEELTLCNYHIYIPTNPSFSSLNIAAAVQIIAYEIKTLQKPSLPFPIIQNELANFDEVQDFYQHLQKLLIASKFLPSNKQTNIMTKLQRLFNRVYMEKNEVNILRGILSILEQNIVKKP